MLIVKHHIVVLKLILILVLEQEFKDWVLELDYFLELLQLIFQELQVVP